MRVIGLVEVKSVDTPKVVNTDNITKTDMISQAEAEGIKLTPAEKRMSKDKLAEVINSKARG